MSTLIKQACEHWHFIAPLLNKPANEQDYNAMVETLDELLSIVGDDENHPMADLTSHMGDLIEAYDEAHRPLPKITGVDVLRYLMQEHGLTQGDLPEVGTQSVISEIIAGKRHLNVRQIRALAERFAVSTEVFF